MTGPFANRLFRIAFALAGIYNLAFGLWAALMPQHFFAVFDLPAPRYPGIWACLGMVVGVYGLLYLDAARKLETAWPIIVVGFLGKLLGPIGMVLSFGDEWPRRVGMLCIYNDVIWWLPFGLFLIRGTALGRGMVRAAPWICAALHTAAVIVLTTLLKRGTLTDEDAWFRAAYIADNIGAWSAGWLLWVFSAMSLVGFYAWWGSSVRASRIATAAVLLAALGTVFDFTGEGLLTLSLVEYAAPALEAVRPIPVWDAPTFLSVERSATLFSGGVANGLYTLGGIMLTFATQELPRWVRISMWITWLAGIAMSVAAFANSVPGLTTSSALLFPLFILWTVWMAARWSGR